MDHPIVIVYTFLEAHEPKFVHIFANILYCKVHNMYYTALKFSEDCLNRNY
jgi:hypothetical protein